MGIIGEFYQMVKSTVRGEYFDFVTKNRVGDEVPVFTYHRVEYDIFSAHLKHLKRNGYETLDSERLEKMLVTGEPLPKQSAVLTFDDGLEDLYTVAYPLLREFGMRCIAFIAPFWLDEPGVVWWSQVQEMHESGVVDFQAHSHSHGRIPISSRVVDFFHPRYPYHQKWEVIQKNHDVESMTHNLPQWGMPIYASASSLSDQKRYLGDGTAEVGCMDFVVQHGGKDFFLDSQWRHKLKSFWQGQESITNQDYETMDEQIDRIRKEVQLSKKIIEEKIPGKRVISFAYPYHERGQITDRLLEEQGYRLVFGGISKTTCFDSKNGGFRCYRRVSGDFVRRLPGAGRTPLPWLILKKGTRRLKRGLSY